MTTLSYELQSKHLQVLIVSGLDISEQDLAKARTHTKSTKWTSSRRENYLCNKRLVRWLHYARVLNNVTLLMCLYLGWISFCIQDGTCLHPFCILIRFARYFITVDIEMEHFYDFVSSVLMMAMGVLPWRSMRGRFTIGMCIQTSQELWKFWNLNCLLTSKFSSQFILHGNNQSVLLKCLHLFILSEWD